MQWHAAKAKEVLDALNSGPQGLSRKEAETRRAKFGPNELRKAGKISPLKLFLHQFKSILIIILLIAILVSAVLGEFMDASVISAIVILCALLGFVQEYRSEKALEALKRMAAPTARIMREGEEMEIPAGELVPGDILLLSAGHKVAADGRIIEEMNLKIDESPLTGESVPVSKSVDPVSPDTGIADRKDMLYSGTTVSYGRGKAVVTATGMETEFGKIAAMLEEAVFPKTPLEKRMEEIGRWLGGVFLAACALATLLGVFRGHPLLEMLIWGTSLAVAAVPEALPAVVTGALAIGIQKMAKRKAIVRRLPAVETLGCTTVICSDKTGTLTKNEMTVRQIYLRHRTIEVRGTGFEPKGEFYTGEKQINPAQDSHLQLLCRIALLCNDADFVKNRIFGDPTEGALVVAALKCGLRQKEVREKYPRISEIPFEPERKRMTTIHSIAGKKTAYVKGAAETLLDLSSHLYKEGRIEVMTEEDKRKVLEVNEEMAGRALRVLAVAYREIPASLKEFTPETVENNLIFVGLLGMIDPPREEVKEAMEICEKAGIKAVMITGDHKLTAAAIARELGQLQGEIITGVELDALEEEELLKRVENISVYARVSPAHKLRIVKALKEKGHVVAVTGDGVNDAPALKQADIGVAMGITGTDVTKEASDMVLADDNFATIVSAIHEGRSIYANIQKYLLYLLRCNVGEIIVLAGSFLIGLPLPLIALQILWVNLTTDGLPAIALGVDPPDPDIMERPPRRPGQSVFTREIKAGIMVLSLNMAVWILPMFAFYLREGLIKAQSMVFAAMIINEMVNAFNSRSPGRSIFKAGWFANKWLVGAVIISLLMMVMVIHVPGLASLFHAVPLTARDWLIAAGIGLIALPVAEILKRFLAIRRD
jgi:Ca2+-transporting ATPase